MFIAPPLLSLCKFSAGFFLCILGLLNNGSEKKMSYYHGLISSRRANSLLNQRPDGTFLLRDSQSQPGNFVLSAKFLGRMYHVLIFQQGGKYILDSTCPPNEGDSGEGGGGVEFNSLDELVLFLTGHNLKVGDDEVHLTDTCPCADDSVRLSSNALRRTKDVDDTDLMTDIFATLFGTRTVVICVAHSSLQLDGQPQQGEQTYWAVLVKDLDLKGYYIKLVDKEEKIVIRDKKVGKLFQYDIPGDLVMTFLSEHGITCIGFRDTQEKDRFLHQIDRLVRLQQDRSMKLRDRAASEATNKKKATEHEHRIKASEFDTENLSPEWSYLFEQAGVSKEMLKDEGTLQFILDTVYDLGDPQELVPSTDSTDGELAALERDKAIALDANLKRESIRASKLCEILQKEFLKSPPPMVRDNVCAYLAACERFKDHLVVKYSMIALGPENANCFCQQCGADKPRAQMTGNPPQQFQLPLGWAQFVHRSRTHTLAMEFSKHWHASFCCVSSSSVPSVMRTGQLPYSKKRGVQLLSPDIQCACTIADIRPLKYQDSATGTHYKVRTVFQVFIQPGTYSVHIAELGGGALEGGQLEWQATERTYIVHSLWICMESAAAK